MAHTLRTITVKELKAALEGFDENMPVVLARPSHDYWRSITAGSFDENEIEVVTLSWSDYHNTWKVPKDEPEEEAEVVEALVLGL